MRMRKETQSQQVARIQNEMRAREESKSHLEAIMKVRVLTPTEHEVYNEHKTWINVHKPIVQNFFKPAQIW